MRLPDASTALKLLPLASLLVSLSAVLISYSQFQLATAAKLSFYRQAIYSAKLESYRDYSSNWPDWDGTLQMIRYHTRAVRRSYRAESQFAVMPVGDFAPEPAAAQQAIDDLSLIKKVGKDLRVNSVVWSGHVERGFFRINHLIDRISSCVMFDRQYATSIPSRHYFEARHPTDWQKAALEAHADTLTEVISECMNVEAAADILPLMFANVDKQMRLEIQADQLQARPE